MKIGIVGLPNVGKSTLFNAITNSKVMSANYPFCTIDPNIGVVPVPDYRLERLAQIYNPKKVTPATIEFVDIAGLVKGASKGEGLGNKFLANIREVDAILHIVRCFEGSDVIHVNGNIDPKKDIEIINLELILSDMEFVEKRIEKAKKLMKLDKSTESALDLWGRVLKNLNDGIPARLMEFTEDEKHFISKANLLTYKPVIYTANLSESDFSTNKLYSVVEEIAKTEKTNVLPISAEFESQISGMDKEDKLEFLSELGLKQSGLERLIALSYKLLGLISYLTAGEPEVRAWTIKKGTLAPQAAGKIHSDFEKGFIRAEVISYENLIKCGSVPAAKEKGLVRSEGKEYIINDGDVVLFRFNV
ncbi:MAG: redox-regulated ATPase YchF [Oscillospiraceae bacterium]|jgi:GTP-binding protein YchF|nr:redox-regulated ATPase YchF [Oscillospiraceae bacterium]